MMMTLIKYHIAEFSLEVLFRRLTVNFSLPSNSNNCIPPVMGGVLFDSDSGEYYIEEDGVIYIWEPAEGCFVEEDWGDDHE